MRIKNIIRTVWIGTFIFNSSCTHDEIPGGGETGRGSEVSLRISALSMEGGAEVTRAATSTPIGTGKNVGFFVKADAGKYVAQTNLKGVYDGTLRSWVPVDSIWLNDHDATLMVYYPYIPGVSGTVLELTAGLFPTADDTGDLSYARFETNNRYLTEGNKKIDITLDPVYARLVLTVVKDATYPVQAKVSKITVSGVSINNKAKIDLATDNYHTYTAGPVACVFPDKIVGLESDASPVIIDLLLIPGALAADVTLSLTLDGKETKVVIDRAKFGNALIAGKKYTATLKIKPGELNIGSVDLADWVAGSGGGIDSGTEFD